MDKKLVARLDALINDKTDGFLKDVKSLEPKFLRAFLDEVRKLDTSGGKLKSDKQNQKKAAEIRAQIPKILKKIGYENAVLDLLANFDQIDTLSAEIQQSAGVKVDKGQLTALQNWAVDKVKNDLLGAGMEQNFTQQIVQELTKSVILGSNLQDTIAALDGAVSGTDEKQGLMQRYTAQVGRDALGQYQGLVNQKIADAYGLNAYQYVGSLVKDSREQCTRWVEKEIILISELPDEIAWANKYGSGMIPGTDVSNFGQFRGGYNCRHIAIPVRVEPDQVNS